MTKWLVVIAGLLLAGCTTITPEERLANDRQTCQNYGFKKRNDAFAKCMMRLDIERRDAARYNRLYLDAWESDFYHRRYRPWYWR